ncbi:recombination protein RecR [Catenovulum sp. SM1970]|uniref:recombination mediator RecR n=1 Tax=Marinifaba aquimaris TaxID=2741323 RepID=UPI001572FB59|nr:recombination mediator RecR [Marinifaba aquimaris]NTS75254.1 recombination protein RecR [Marinifaba aquimaris]
MTPLLEDLITALKVLPGVGQKSAQRMAFNLLDTRRDGALKLSKALSEAIDGIKHCVTCRNYSETEQCEICQSAKRHESGQVCVVASPADVVAIEQTGHFNGRYFVLMGLLSPLDGIGPNELGLDLLSTQISQGDIKELILATNPTVEGEATAHYIAELASGHDVKVSRIAQGVPVGGELDLIDGKTLGHAFAGRQAIE